MNNIHPPQNPVNITRTNSISIKEEKHPIVIEPKFITKVLSVITVSLAIAHVISYLLIQFVFHGENHLTQILDRLFNLMNEANFPTFFSAGLLLSASAILYFIYKSEKSINKKLSPKYWLVLSFVFLFLCLDESLQLHDELVETIRSRFTGNMSGYLYEGWVIPYAGLVLIVGAYFLNFVLRLPAKTRNLFILSGFIYVGAALGLEFFEGYEEKLNGSETFTFWFYNTVEEICEMGGLIIFIYALLDYLAPIKTEIKIAHK